MWVYDGDCALGDEWVDSFMKELNEVTEYNKENSKYFEPYDCFYEALNQWGEGQFMHYKSQDEFVSEVGLETCIDLIKENDGSSLEDATSGIRFCVFACESAFNQCISWEDDEENDSVEESIRSRRARKSMFESRRSISHRAKARRIR